MLYIANLISIVGLVFAISFLMAEPWGKSEKNHKQNIKIVKNNFK